MAHQLIAAASASVCLFAAFAASPSMAAEEQAEMRVKIGDLNLRSDSGAEHALQRIRAASTTFCGAREGVRELRRSMEARKCRSKMTYLAVGKLDAPLVTARYERTGSRPPILLASR